MDTIFPSRHLILESRIARLRNAAMDLSNRIVLTSGIAAEEALSRRLNLVEEELEVLQAELAAMTVEPQQGGRALDAHAPI